MKILVVSCDKNEDLWYPFYHCMEKYWPDHPEIIYSTETKINPYYKTICKNYPISKWTRRVRETVEDIETENILVMVDDIFIREKVNSDKVLEFEKYLGGWVAGVNLHQRARDGLDINIDNNVQMRRPGGLYKCSLMCQLWNKNKLLDVFDWDTDPWTFEDSNKHKNYIYLIYNSNDCVFNWGNKFKNGHYGFGVNKGKWRRECKEFFDNEGINIDYSIRGFCD